MDPLRTHSLASRPASVSTASPSPPVQPTNDDIEAVIQMATSARPSPDGRTGPLRDTRTQLFVGNLPYRVRWQDLKDLFRRAGTVLRADVSLGPDNRSRGYGTVLLATAEDAGRAVDMFNGYSWQTRILEVRPDRLPPDFDNPLGNLSVPSVGGFTGSAPASLVASPYHASPNPMSSIASVSDDLDYTSLFGHDHPAATSSASACRNLFVGNLPFHCQWQDLKDLFRQAGTIIRADVALGPDGRSRGFGTVVFATELDAERAVKMFNGYEYNGRALKVHYDKFSQASQPSTTPASPVHPSFQTSSSSMGASPALSHVSAYSTGLPSSSHPSHITLPAGYQLDFGPPSGPASPYDMFNAQMQMAMQQQQQHLQQQQRQHEQQYAQAKSHLQQQQQQQQSRLFTSQTLLDIENLANSFASTKLSTSASSQTSSASSVKAPSLSTSSSSSSANSAPTSSADSSLMSASHAHYQRHHQSSSSSTSQQQQQQQQSHPHHPGPISLPPLPQVSFSGSPLTPQHHGLGMSISPLDYSSMGSPLHYPSYQPSHPQLVSMTPHGLPPITPSMPPFTFLPPTLSPHHHPSQVHAMAQHQQQLQQHQQSLTTPQGHFGSNQQYTILNPLPSPGLSQGSSPMHATHAHHLLGTFSPGVAMSPGTLWGRPGDPNPFINPAVGAPVHMHSPGNGGFFYAMSSPHQGPAHTHEPKGYFDPAFFPPMAAPGLGPSGLANEILKDKSEGGKEGEGKRKEDEQTVVGGGDSSKGFADVVRKEVGEGATDSSPSEVGTGETPESDRLRSSSASTGTSWHTHEDDHQVSSNTFNKDTWEQVDESLALSKERGLQPRTHSLNAMKRPGASSRSESDPSDGNSRTDSQSRPGLQPWHGSVESAPASSNTRPVQ